MDQIKKARATFTVENTAALMSAYGVNSVKAPSSSKADIDADVLISNDPSSHRMGFSVKSYIGGPPTLVNSSSHGNFVFGVEGFAGDIEPVNEIMTRTKVRDRIKEIVKNGGALRFDHVSSEIFQRNLHLQDSAYPRITAEMLLLFFSGNVNGFNELGNMVARNLQDTTETEIQIATKRYLRSSALTMVPGTEWMGKLNTRGGYIVVLENGDLVCYNIYFDDDFKDYLYANCRFDTPSTKKYKFGRLYEKSDGLYFSLNLQVRFK